MAALLAGLPVEVPGATVNRLCGSGPRGRRLRLLGRSRTDEGNILIGRRGRVDDPGAVRPGQVRASLRSQPWRSTDTSLGWRFVNPKLEAEVRHPPDGRDRRERSPGDLDVKRERPGRLRLSRATSRAITARDEGRFKDELLPLEIPQRKSAAITIESGRAAPPGHDPREARCASPRIR